MNWRQTSRIKFILLELVCTQDTNSAEGKHRESSEERVKRMILCHFSEPCVIHQYHVLVKYEDLKPSRNSIVTVKCECDVITKWYRGRVYGL